MLFQKHETVQVKRQKIRNAYANTPTTSPHEAKTLKAPNTTLFLDAEEIETSGKDRMGRVSPGLGLLECQLFAI